MNRSPRPLRRMPPSPPAASDTRVPGGLLVPARRGTAPDPVVAASRENHRVGVDDVPCAVLKVEAVGPEDDIVPDQESGDVYGVEDRDLEPGRAVHQRALDFEAGVVTGK